MLMDEMNGIGDTEHDERGEASLVCAIFFSARTSGFQNLNKNESFPGSLVVDRGVGSRVCIAVALIPWCRGLTFVATMTHRGK